MRRSFDSLMYTSAATPIGWQPPGTGNAVAMVNEHRKSRAHPHRLQMIQMLFFNAEIMSENVPGRATFSVNLVCITKGIARLSRY